MPSIGSLNASLKLESASFISALTKASQATAQATSAMQSTMLGLGKSFDAVGEKLKHLALGFLGLEGLRELQQIVRTADEIGDSAQRLGIASEDLQRFRFAAQQSGASVEQLDNALKLFTKNLAAGKIQAQGGTFIDQFADVIRQIRDAPTKIDEVTIATKAAGKGFSALLQIARESPEAFRAAYNEAAVFSEKALQSADRLDKQFRALKDALEVGFGTGILEAFTNGLGLTEDKLKSLEKLAKEAGIEIANTIQTTIQEFNAIASTGSTVIQFFIDKWKEAKALQDQVAASDFGLAAPKGHQGPFAPGGALGAGLEPIVEKPMGVPAATEQQEKFAKSLQLSVDQTHALITATKEGQATFNAVNDQFEATEAVLRQGIDTSSAYGQSLIKLGVEGRQAARELHAAEEQMRFLPQLAQQFGDALSSSFADAVVDGKKFSDVLKDLTKDLERLAINAFLKQLIGSATTTSSAGTGILGALLHSGGVAGAGGGQRRSISAAAFMGAPRLHSGLQPGEFPAILQKGEGVFTPEQMRALGGRTQVNIINNNPNADVKQDQHQEGGVDVTDVIIGTVKRGFSTRQFDSEMALFGGRRGTTVR